MNAATFTPVALAEAVGRLGAMPGFLAGALASVARGDLARQPKPGWFSLAEHACHLRDLEREGYLVRVRRMLSETLPTLEGFDGTAVAQARNYQAQDARVAAQEFAAARRETTGILAATTPDDLAREAIFADKRITLRDLVAMIEAHDAGHREEIERLIEALEDL
jgi:hypothetical protein